LNLALGIGAVAVGAGAALSNLVAGTIAQSSGYATSFVALAGVAGAALALFGFAMPEPRHGGIDAAKAEGAALKSAVVA
jgi:sugar phosphate permease